MELHTAGGSPNSRKVEAVIDHLGLPVTIVRHDFAELRRPEYLALNPNGMVPTLVDGAFTLWEANAIMQYLADKAGSDELFPRDSQKRADVVRWQCWELTHFNKAFGTLAFEIVAKPRLNIGPTDEALVRIAQADLARFAPVLEGHLAGRAFMVGEGITIADYAMIPLEGYRGAVPFDWAPFPSINSYFDRMRQVDSWVKTDPKRAASDAVRSKAA
jgi:glutathione S-transferase